MLTYIPFFFPFLLFFNFLSYFFDFFPLSFSKVQTNTHTTVTSLILSLLPVLSLHFLHFLFLPFIVCKQLSHRVSNHLFHLSSKLQF